MSDEEEKQPEKVADVMAGPDFREMLKGMSDVEIQAFLNIVSMFSEAE